MPFYGPISRNNLIRAFRKLGFEGPYSGGRHEYMLRGSKRIVIPNPHRGDISIRLLHELLKEAGISREEWERA